MASRKTGKLASRQMQASYVNRRVVPEVPEVDQPTVVEDPRRRPSKPKSRSVSDRSAKDRPEQRKTVRPARWSMWNPHAGNWQSVRVIEQKLKYGMAEAESGRDGFDA